MIFVTGGTGFIGSHLLYHLVSKGQRVKALKRAGSSLQFTRKIFSYYTEELEKLFSLIDWVEGDLNDADSMREVMFGSKQVYHAGAVVSFHTDDKSEIIQTNIEGTANIVNICLELKIDKLLFVSSIGALGRATAKGVVDEETHFQSSSRNSVYSTTKYEAEKEIWRGIAEGLNAVIINPAIVVGPGDWSKGSSQVFETMWKGLKFYSTGMNGFIDVNDVARVMMILMDGNYSGERFILSSENISYKQFFEWMAAEMEIPPPSIKANALLSAIGWRYLKLKGLLSGKRSGITRETTKTANSVYQYSNKKLIDATGVELLAVKESVKNTSRLFLQDHPRQ